MPSTPSTFTQLRQVAALANAGNYELAVQKLQQLPLYVRAPYIALLFLHVATDWLFGRK